MWKKKLRMEERATTIYWRTNSTTSELVFSGEVAHGWNEDFAALWNEAMEEVILREQEVRTASLVQTSICSCGMWRTFQRGRHREDMEGARGARASCARCLLDLEKDHRRSSWRMREPTSANGDIVTETTEGHGVFATPPCPGQRRLAIVVAADITHCNVGSSFIAKETLRAWTSVGREEIHSDPLAPETQAMR